jgi:hypothetical protein
MTLLWIAIAALAVVSVGLDAFSWRNVRRTPQLCDVAGALAATPPRVSVIMAARDEADRIGPAIAARLADTYPDLELILVDDRSTDGSGEIARHAAGGDPRLTIVRVDGLPAGWLGKVHALSEGVARATGDYLLFSDADVTVAPDATMRAVALCETDGVDCLGLIPEYQSSSVLVDAVWTVFIRGLGIALGSPRFSEPKSKTVVGSGAFTLVRRTAYERTPGFEHLRMETGDDMALAMMVQAAGGRCATVLGSGCVRVGMYDSVVGFLRGIEKNGSTGAGNAAAICAGLVAFAAVDVMPLVAALAGPAWLRALGVATALFAWVANIAILRATCRLWAPALLWPVGSLLFAFGTARSIVLAKLRGGVSWRGTFYTLAELEAGRRFTL